MRKTLIAVVALLAIAATLVAAASGGTDSSKQRVRIDVKGLDWIAFVLRPMSHGRVQSDNGAAAFCCWRSWSVTRAGARLEVTNPLITLSGKRGTLKIRERIEWVGLPDDWSIQTGTWKVVGGTGTFAGLSGHGRIASVWAPEADPNQELRVRLFGFLKSK